ncbi:MAG TPA: MMPL family transporter [Jiangellaceae bacterium]
MLTRLATFVVWHARIVLVVSTIAMLGAAAVGFGAFGKLQTGGFEDPAAESRAAAELLAAEGGTTDLVLLARTASGTVDDPEVQAAGTRLTERLRAEPGIGAVDSYWSTQAQQLRSNDGTEALVLVDLAEADDDAIAESYVGDVDGLTVVAGGEFGVGQDIGDQVGRDLAIAESIAVPLILVLLVFAFGSLVAALLPLAIGLVAILGTFGELSVIAEVTDVSIYAINITTALGLGLAIDYALLVVSRFREELGAPDSGVSVGDAVVRTVSTAGRTIVFSGLAVAAALATLLVFPLYFLRSFAYAGIGVVAISAFGALVLLPALLAVLGRRVNAGALPWSKAVRGAEAPFWGRLAGAVMRRPLVTAAPVVAVLLLAAAPLLDVRFGTPDERVLPETASSRQVGDALREDFPVRDNGAIQIVTTAPVADTDLAAYADRLSVLPDVERVDSRLGTTVAGTTTPPDAAAGGGTEDTGPAPAQERLAIVTAADPTSDAARELVRSVRAVPDPAGAAALVGGDSAALVDSLDAVGGRLPLAIGPIVLTTFVVLFLFTGSLVQPIRALLCNALVLGATLGVMVLIFQEGALSSALGFTPMPLDTSMLVLLFCIAFGLSMDYEVFVMSRIKERYDGGDTLEEATVTGLARTGRIVTTAAVLLAVSFFAFGTSQVTFLQLFGLGSGLAVLLDATLVRGVLVPASMRLLGRHAWYAPRVLRRVHARVGLSEA